MANLKIKQYINIQFYRGGEQRTADKVELNILRAGSGKMNKQLMQTKRKEHNFQAERANQGKYIMT